LPPAYRLHRLFHPRSGRCIDVAVDHGFFGEPRFLAGIEDMEPEARMREKVDRLRLLGLSPAQRDAVWFICAEALSNATKHADPQRVAVAVRRDGDDLVVTVRDDGRGGASMGGGSGLRGLRERAEALHGGLEVRSPHSGGTEVRAWLPVNSSLLAATEAG